MSSIDYLRAKVAAYRPTFRLPLCLDEAKRADIDAAVAALAEARKEVAKLDSLPPDAKRSKSIAAKSPTREAREKVAAAEVALQAAEDAAADDVIVLVWSRLDPDAYDALIASHMTNGHLDAVAAYPAMVEASWDRAESATGEDVGLTWPEAQALLNNADRDAVTVGVLNLNRAPSAIPFSPRSSGQPGMSSKPA